MNGQLRYDFLPTATIREPKYGKLECKNKWQLHSETFERTWVSKVQSGWKPAGVF